MIMEKLICMIRLISFVVVAVDENPDEKA